MSLENAAKAIVVTAVALVAGALLGGYHGSSKVQSKWDAERAAQAVATQVADHKQRELEQQRGKEIDRIKDEAKTQVQTAQADADAAATVAERLQQRVNSLVAASRASKDTGAAARGEGEPNSDPLDLLAELFTRADSAAGELAGYADQLRIAGLACEASFDALSDKSNVAAGF